LWLFRETRNGNRRFTAIFSREASPIAIAIAIRACFGKPPFVSMQQGGAPSLAALAAKSVITYKT